MIPRLPDPNAAVAIPAPPGFVWRPTKPYGQADPGPDEADGTLIDNGDPEEHSRRRLDISQQLSAQDVPADIPALRLTGHAPLPSDWHLLGERLTRVAHLGVEVPEGGDVWAEESLPSHWPLESVIVTAINPASLRLRLVYEGRVPHVVFMYCDRVWPSVSFSMDELAAIETLYASSSARSTAGSGDGNDDAAPKGGTSGGEGAGTVLQQTAGPRLHTLELIENDAAVQFIFLSSDLPAMLRSVSNLAIRSTSGEWHTIFPNSPFYENLATLTNLRHLELTLSEMHGAASLAQIPDAMPSGLESLWFRGPVGREGRELVKVWVERFRDPEYLPGLRKLGFVLDVALVKGEGERERVQGEAEEEDLRLAREACDALWEVMRVRSVVEERIEERWESPGFILPVDSRWYSLRDKDHAVNE